MTQKNKIKQHLKKFGKINPLDALGLYGCFRLGARIWDLKEEGMKIKTIINPGVKKYAIYTWSK